MVKKADSKTINVLGMRVDNYTVRESLLRLDTYLGGTGLNIIETVTMRKLLMAGEYPVIRNCLSQADFCVIGECGILSETGSASAQRMREVRDRDFLKELAGRMERGRKRVFLIAMTQTRIERMKELFSQWVPNFKEAGSYAVESSAQDMDAVVNEINGSTPDIVISALDSPMEEEFVTSHKDKIGTSVWYGIGADFDVKTGIGKAGSAIKGLALRGRLRHSVWKYGKGEGEDKKRV